MKVVGPKNRFDVDGVTERPQTLISEAAIKTAMLVFGEGNVTKTVARSGGRHVREISRADTTHVGVPVPVCHP
jgi:hypothetical protein